MVLEHVEARCHSSSVGYVISASERHASQLTSMKQYTLYHAATHLSQMSASEEWLTAVVGLRCITSTTRLEPRGKESRAFCAIYPSSQRITMDSSYLPPSQLLFSTFSAAITLAHFLLPILKPQSADLQYLVSPASPAAAIVILGTYYSVAILL